MSKNHRAKAITLIKCLPMLAFVLATSGLSQARSENRNWIAGHVLMKECSEASALCKGYILGVVDAELALAETLGRKPFFCVPDEVTHANLQSIVIAHYEKNPRDGKNGAARAVLIAFTRAFPCG